MRHFALLADPLRREVVELLADGPVTAGAIAARFPVSRPAVSRHLRLLRDAGLVRSEVRAQSRLYVLDRAALVELDRWLDRFRPLNSAEAPASGPAARLDALGTELHRGRRARRQAPTRGDNRDTG